MQPAQPLPPKDRLLPIKAVMGITSLGRRTLYDLMQRDEFPASCKLTSKRIGWRESEIMKWIQERT